MAGSNVAVMGLAIRLGLLDLWVGEVAAGLWLTLEAGSVAEEHEAAGVLLNVTAGLGGGLLLPSRVGVCPCVGDIWNEVLPCGPDNGDVASLFMPDNGDVASGANKLEGTLGLNLPRLNGGGEQQLWLFRLGSANRRASWDSCASLAHVFVYSLMSCKI